MENQLSVFIGNDEYVCTQFYDVESDTSGVDVCFDTILLGEIWGLDIPGVGDEDEEYTRFNEAVTRWVEAQIELGELQASKNRSLEHIPDFINMMDWELLRGQKLSILNICEKVLTPEQIENITGVISILDAIQDYAVDVAGVDEGIVFNNKENI